MAKKKNSVALFEVIGKTKRSESGMNVPKWFDGQAPAPAEAGGPSPAARPAPTGPVEPLLTVVGDRLRLSLNYLSCLVAALGAVVLLVAVFSLGYWSGSSPAPVGPDSPPAGDGTMSGRTPIGRHVVDGQGNPGGAPAPAGNGGSPPAPAAGARVKGKYYMVIQQLLGGMTQESLVEATRIAKFCNDNGHPATVGTFRDRQRYVVWSLKPFDSATGAANTEFALVIEALGKRYFREHQPPTYDFRQRRDNQLDPLFVQYK